MHKYTEEEQLFMEKYVPGHSYREIANAFTETFGWEISIGQVNSYIGNHHLNTGRTGQFEKGTVPPNKGMKGICALGCEKTWFKKGNIPVNYRPVGSERINVDGYVEIKVAEPRKWKLKHRVVWEKTNGPVPKSHVVIFKDNNKLNTDIDNLILIKRGAHAILNHLKLCKYTGEFKYTAIAIAELKKVTHNKQKHISSVKK